MKVDITNYIQVTSSKFIVLCSCCMCEINSKLDTNLCRIEGCLYQICSKPECHDIIDNFNYCKYCVEASKSWDVNNGTDSNWFEPKFNAGKNEDFVSAFQKVGDDDDIASATVINISIACNSIFDKLSVNPVIKHIDKIPCTIAFPEPGVLDIRVPFESNDLSTSNQSNESDDISHATSLDEYTNQFIITDWLCDVKTQILKILNNNSSTVNLK